MSSELRLKDGSYVRNVPGTGDQRPQGRNVSWKKHYVRSGERQWPRNCCISNCKERADGGGHVHVKGHRSGVYIVPMCDKKHNTAQNMEWLRVKQGTAALRVDNVDENGWCVIV